MPDYHSGQPEARRAMIFTDQHGRKWHGIIEIKTGHPCTPISPLGWMAPLDVPQQFIRFSILEPNLVVIDYRKWISALEDALTTWRRKLTQTAKAMFPADAGKNIAKPPPQLLEEVGPKPGATEPVQAALGGNKWVLGLSDNKPPWASAYFPDKPEVPVKFSDFEEEADAVANYAAMFPDVEEEEEPVMADAK